MARFQSPTGISTRPRNTRQTAGTVYVQTALRPCSHRRCSVTEGPRIAFGNVFGATTSCSMVRNVADGICCAGWVLAWIYTHLKNVRMYRKRVFNILTHTSSLKILYKELTWFWQALLKGQSRSTRQSTLIHRSVGFPTKPGGHLHWARCPAP